MININSLFPSNSNAPDASYPYGSARNVTVSGDNTGTPFIASLQNDIIGLQQYLLSEAGVTPSGSPDTVLDSQQFTALWNILNMRTMTHNITVDADYTLTSSQNLRLRYVITDTNPFLTTSRNIIVDEVERRFLAVNNTLQTLTFKTLSGTGIDVLAGETKDLYGNGTNIIGSIENEVSGVMSTDNFLHIQDQQVAGTISATSTAATWNARDLNTVKTNNILGASLSTNEITLPIGTYKGRGSFATALNGTADCYMQMGIWDGTDFIDYGMSCKPFENEPQIVISPELTIDFFFTITEETTIDFRQYTEKAGVFKGLGSNAPIAPTTQIVADIEIYKVG